MVSLAQDLLADGYVRVERALDPAFCEAVVERAFERMGMVEADPSTWPRGRTYLFCTQIVGGAVSNLASGLVAGTVREVDGRYRFADLQVILDFTDSVVFTDATVHENA